MELISIVQNDIFLFEAIVMFIVTLVLLFLVIVCNKASLSGLDVLCGICAAMTLISAITLLNNTTYTVTLDASEATYMEVAQRMMGLEYTTNLDGAIEIIMGEENLYKWCFVNNDLQPEEFLSLSSKN